MTTLQDRLKRYKEFDRRECFANSEDGMLASMFYGDMLELIETILPDLEELATARGKATQGEWSIHKKWGSINNSINNARICNPENIHVASMSRDADKRIDQKEADADFIVTAARIAEKLKKVVG